MASSRAQADPTPGVLAPLLPLGEANRRLRASVHPPDWRNPAPRKSYDLVVMGGGTAGLVTAAIGAALGAHVALVERHLLGGDCLNVGCVPSKALIRAARSWDAARRSARDFAGPEAGGPGDFAAAMERMRRIRADIGVHDSAARFRDLGVDVFLGEGRFTGPERVEVAGAALHFRRAVIATGTRPAVPPIPGLEEAGYLTNETVFSLTAAPEHLLVIGGGPIGCELGQAFARLGSRVTVVERGDRLLSHDDPEAAAVVRRALERDGVEVLTGTEVVSAEAAGDERRLVVRRGDAERELTGDALLVASGRSPNVEGIGLEAAGVRFGRDGVEVDDRLQTSNGSVYAVGDVNGQWAFTHAADAQARMVVRNALFYGRGKLSELVMPWVTYTSPELAHVGISAEDAAKRGDEVESITVPLSEVDRARLDGETEGFLRVHLQGGSDRILGATLVAEHAGEIISLLTAAMTAGTGLGRLGETVFPYPTQAEVVRKAADAWRRRKLTPLAKRGFELFFRLLR